tara:strand:+ start:1340 stop:2356 length:1017 start_codon:yes stop_codon:yes gene_type:complete
MKVLITGHSGYVGRVLTKLLVENNYEVVGCDTNYFPTTFDDNDYPEILNISPDIRDITIENLKEIDVVVHLAGLSNDPLGELNSQLTHEINYLSTVKLAELSKNAGVKKFIFSSSCATYGKTSTIVNEESDLEPLTQYAKSKINSEFKILELADDVFYPTILRNATAYGYSPNLRLDIVVNNLTASAFVTGKVKLLSDGTAWRPLLHVEDMANAFLTVMKAQNELAAGQIFNVGNNNDNFSVREIAEQVQEIVPDSKVEFANQSNKDFRSYKVDFDKIAKVLNFKTKWNLKDGIKQLYDVFIKEKFSESDFHDKKFHRINQLKWLIEEGHLDGHFKIN